MTEAWKTICQAWTGEWWKLPLGIIGTAIGAIAFLVAIILPMLAGGML